MNQPPDVFHERLAAAVDHAEEAVAARQRALSSKARRRTRELVADAREYAAIDWPKDTDETQTFLFLRQALHDVYNATPTDPIQTSLRRFLGSALNLDRLVRTQLREYMRGRP